MLNKLHHPTIIKTYSKYNHLDCYSPNIISYSLMLMLCAASSYCTT